MHFLPCEDAYLRVGRVWGGFVCAPGEETQDIYSVTQGVAAHSGVGGVSRNSPQDGAA